MSRYQATIAVAIYDEETGRFVTMTRVEVEFDPPGDPRELLTKAALREAAESAEIAERWLNS